MNLQINRLNIALSSQAHLPKIQQQDLEQPTLYPDRMKETVEENSEQRGYYKQTISLIEMCQLAQDIQGQIWSGK